MPKEDNPFLGLRGIRLALTRPEVLETQFRAMLMAAAGVPAAGPAGQGRPLRIMLPMVKDIAEFRDAIELLESDSARGSEPA